MAQPYLQHYRELLDEHGAGFEATGWRSKRAQAARFGAIASAYDLSGKTFIDAGAGQADLAAFLLEKHIAYARCIALDAMPEMVELCLGRNLAGLEAHAVDFVGNPAAFEPFGAKPALGNGTPAGGTAGSTTTAGQAAGIDAVVFSGSLNTLEQHHALDVLDRAWNACGDAIVFNFLSSECGTQIAARNTGPANRFDPIAVLRWAMQRTQLVDLQQSYLLGHDATVAMRKPAAVPNATTKPPTSPDNQRQ